MNFYSIVESLLIENTTQSTHKKQGGSGLVSGLVTNTGKYSSPNTGKTAQVFTPSRHEHCGNEDICSTKGARGAKGGSRGDGLKGHFKDGMRLGRSKNGNLKARSSKKDFNKLTSNSPLHKAGVDFFQ